MKSAAMKRSAMKRSAIMDRCTSQANVLGMGRTGQRLQESSPWRAATRVLGLTVVLFSLSGCDWFSAERDRKGTDWEARPVKSSDGPRFEDPDFVLEAGVPSRCQEVGVLSPPSGWKRLSIPIELRGLTSRAVPVSPLLFSLEDQGGHRYRPTLAGCHPAFQPRELAQGGQLDAHLSFDVAPGAERLELVFEPFLIGRSPLAARVDVPPLPPAR